MRLEEIRQLIDLLIEKDVAEFELDSDEVKVRIRRTGEPPAVRRAGVAPAESGAEQASTGAAPQPAVAPESGGEPEETREAVSGLEDAYILKSPMVGTLYRAPDPESDPFVDVGDIVEEGQTLCIVEAMKLMNEIASEVRGEVVAILVEDGQPVEYGQELFAIEPHA